MLKKIFQTIDRWLEEKCEICKYEGDDDNPLISDGIGIIACKKCWGDVDKKPNKETLEAIEELENMDNKHIGSTFSDFYEKFIAGIVVEPTPLPKDIKYSLRDLIEALQVLRGDVLERTGHSYMSMHDEKAFINAILNGYSLDEAIDYGYGRK